MAGYYDTDRGDLSLDILTLTHRLTRAYENEGIHEPQEIENDVTSLATLHSTTPEAAPLVETLLFAIEETQANAGINEAAADAVFTRGREALRALIPFFPSTGRAIS